MKTESRVSLKPFNTFGLQAMARKLVVLEDPMDAPAALEQYPDGMIIGGGSNILLSQDNYDVVLLNRIKGIQVIEENTDHVLVAAGSGVIWHELVLWAIAQGYGGLENLSLIPGTVGAAPIQNIGAYGVELKDVLEGLNYYMYEQARSSYVAVEHCQFGYRDSIFKNEWKNKGFISEVFFRLTRGQHYINSDYNALKTYLEDKDIAHPSIRQISDAVIAIRQSKLPDWNKIGNAGSFFKNPVIKDSFFESLKMDYPGIPSYPVDDRLKKIPAAWLIQEAGFKGIRIGSVGTYPLQPLVLVNYGGASASDLLHLKDTIQSAVLDIFGIELTPEVTIL